MKSSPHTTSRDSDSDRSSNNQSIAVNSSSSSTSSSSSDSDNESNKQNNKKRKLDNNVHPSRQLHITSAPVSVPKSTDIINDRSCIIFISQLNTQTTELQLTDIFKQYGPIRHIRLLLNRKKQSRCLCYIEYTNSDDAQSACQHSEPIDNQHVKIVISDKPSEFVHTQPSDTWIEPPKKLTREQKIQRQSELDRYNYNVKRASELGLPVPSKPAQPRVKIMRSDGTWVHQVSEKPYNCMTVYITNLAYNTTETQLRELFESCGEITYLNLCRNSETQQLKGFAYVQYSDTESTDTAINKYNEYNLNDRIIRVDYARPLRERYANHATYKKPQVSAVGKTGAELAAAAEQRTKSAGTTGRTFSSYANSVTKQ